MAAGKASEGNQGCSVTRGEEKPPERPAQPGSTQSDQEKRAGVVTISDGWRVRVEAASVES
jgi:hypothetical protein